MKILRSIGAVVAGFVTVVVLAVLTDAVLVKLQILPDMELTQSMSVSLLLLTVIYQTIYSAVGGYITARLAPSRQLVHAAILGILGVVTIIPVAGAMWNMGYHWYPIVLALQCIPACLIGGWLYARRAKAS